MEVMRLSQRRLIAALTTVMMRRGSQGTNHQKFAETSVMVAAVSATPATISTSTRYRRSRRHRRDR